MHLPAWTNVARQADQRVTGPASDLQHPLARGDSERATPEMTGGVLARISNQIVRAADPIIKISRPPQCRSSYRHGPG